MKTYDDQEQLALSHSFLNTINCCLQGKYSRLNARLKLQLGGVQPQQLQQMGQDIETVMAHFEALWQKQIDSLNAEPLSEGAQQIVHQHRILKQELGESALQLDTLIPRLKQRDSTVYPELTTYVVERAYARDYYIRGLVQYCEVFQLEESADRWRQHILHTREEIRIASYFFQVLMEEGTLNEEQHALLVQQSLLLPGIYRCQMQDFNMNESRRKGETAFAVFDFTAEQSQQWQREGFAPQEAAYWAAYGFNPSDAGVWRQIGFQYPGEAASWYTRGYDPTSASVMAMAGVSPWQVEDWERRQPAQTPDKH